MNVAKDIEPVTALKARSAELIRRARTGKQPIIITQNGKATAALFVHPSLRQSGYAPSAATHLPLPLPKSPPEHGFGVRTGGVGLAVLVLRVFKEVCQRALPFIAESHKGHFYKVFGHLLHVLSYFELGHGPLQRLNPGVH